MKKSYIILNEILYLASFIIIYIIKYGNLSLNAKDYNFIMFYMLSTFICSLVAGKYKKGSDYNYLSELKIFFKAFLFNLGLMTLTVNFISVLTLSRLLLAGSLSLGFIFELVSIYFRNRNQKKIDLNVSYNFSITIFITKFAILFWVVLFSLKNIPLAEYDLSQVIWLLAGIFAVWTITGFVNHEFESFEDKRFLRIFWNLFKSLLTFLFILSALLFLTHLDASIKVLFITKLLLYSFWNLTFVSIYYIQIKKLNYDEVNIRVLGATEISDETEVISQKISDNRLYDINDNSASYDDQQNASLKTQIEYIYLKNLEPIKQFLEKFILLDNFNLSKSVILRSADIYNTEVLPKNYLQFYMNLHELNDIRRINNYLITVSSCLIEGGIFIGKFETNKLRRHRFECTYPFYLARFLYFVDILWRRVTPKLPFLKKIYFFISQGRNRALSMAEGLGRLYFCGFDILNIKEYEHFLYFIATKKRMPSTDSSPSYGPLFKMKRIGLNGKLIKVYKLRTMHPYSEYIQKLVYDIFGTIDGDKAVNDFRVTFWGRFMRKLWIDELPMLINYIKGELKLVGIRPLSEHKLFTYPDELRVRRLNYKPGLIPPYYVHLPKTKVEFFQAEEKYLNEYDNSPFITDIKYFFRAWYNILIKKARSG